MHKLVPALVLVTAASALCGASVAAQTRLQSGLRAPSETGSGGAIVLIGGMTGGGMTGGGMTGGGMTGGGMTGGGMTGGGMTGGGMMRGPVGNFGASGNAAQPENSAQSAYYTYQCVTPAAQCSFVAPASLRSTSLKAGAVCSCSGGRSEGHVR